MANQNLATVPALRPARLNYAGWCIYCGVQYCEAAQCIRQHTTTVWGPCSTCGGSQCLDSASKSSSGQLCGVCIGGLTEYDSPEEVAAFIARQPVRHLSIVPDTDIVVSGYSCTRTGDWPAAGNDPFPGWGL